MDQMGLGAASSFSYVIDVNGEKCGAKDRALGHNIGSNKRLRNYVFSFDMIREIAGEPVIGGGGQNNTGEPS